MPNPLPFTASRLTAGLAALIGASALPALPGATDRPPETIVLDPMDVRAEKERTFSLPLDARSATGSRLALPVRDLPASVSIITRDLIDQRGLRTAVEAVEAAVGITGGTNFGSIPTYTTRGFSGNNVTILRDGIRQNTASQSSRQIDSFLLDRIEVLKGPSSLLFGEGAVGGAVNYVSKLPDRTPQRLLAATVGEWDTYRLGVGAGGPTGVDGLYYRADLSYSSTSGFVDRNEQEYFGAAGALRWEATDRLTLTWQGTWLQDSVESYYGTPVIYDAVVNTTVPGAQPEVRRFVSATDRFVNPRIEPATRRTNYNILDNFAETENSFNRLGATFQATPALSLRNESYVATQFLEWRNLESAIWNPVTRLVDRTDFLLIYRNDVLVGNRFDGTWEGEVAGRPLRVLAGHQFERNDQRRGGRPGNVGANLPAVTLLQPNVGVGPVTDFQTTAQIVVQTHAFFTEAVWKVLPALQVVGGARYDEIAVQRDTLPNPTVTPRVGFSTFRTRYEPWTGRAGVVATVAPEINLYASWSTAAEPVTQLVSLGSAQADFSLQKGRQYEAGLKGTFLSGTVDVTAALFDIEKTDLLSSTFDATTGTRLSQQIGAQVSQGVEVAVAWSPVRAVRIEANTAWTDASFEDFNENLGTGIIARSGNTPPNIAEWVASLFGSWEFRPGWRVDGTVRYVGERFANNANTVTADAYTTVDAGLTYTWQAYTVSIRGRNLLDEEYEPIAGTTQRRLADPISGEISIKVGF